ncbi:hypothetical protein LCGC14_2624720 [marine sediment metagenome]|uniref:Uncharacterized protein n=1 Tax=marine sediment metagenome TaxID=412755 RepID=A0A0F9CD15_9ZZZZ
MTDLRCKRCGKKVAELKYGEVSWICKRRVNGVTCDTFNKIVLDKELKVVV